MDMAGKIYDFSTQTAGSDMEASYYANIMKSISDYNDAKKTSPADAAKMKEAKKTIADFAKDLLSTVNDLKGDSKKLHEDIGQFQTVAYSSWASLNAKSNDIKRRLDKADAKHLDTTINALQDASLNQRLEYDIGMSL